MNSQYLPQKPAPKIAAHTKEKPKTLKAPVKQKKLKALDATGNVLVAFGRGLKLGLANFWRNKVLSIATVMVMAVIIFIFNIILTIQFVSNEALQTLSEHVDIVIYLRDDIDFYDAKHLTEALEQVDGVKQVKYTSKDEALGIVGKTHPKTADFLRKFNLKNPLPPSISITTSSAEDHINVQTLLEKPEYKPLMQSYITQGSSNESLILSAVAKNLGNVSKFVRQIIFWMVLVFVLGGTLVVVNAIQLTIYTRRSEIHIMRLVGATPNFIRMPFIFEGILYGVFAILVSFMILAFLSNSIQIENSNLWDYYQSLQFDRIILGELFISVMLAIISSYSAVEKYLKGKLTVNA
ncbi:FtsX-like permease family protein [Candidatus Peregrinibacteria bacterium]|nr:FtsX-like permease family protein [Candidatus Peregrinibacteria bacterium]